MVFFRWGLLAFVISPGGTRSFGNPHRRGARSANLVIATITPVALGLAAVYNFLFLIHWRL
jgi:hypothetical protein